MITPRDPEYAEAKLYKLGKRRMVPPFSSLAEWIEQQYGVLPLQVRLDPPGDRPMTRYRLDVVLDTEDDRALFRSGLNYDPAKQAAIGEQFLALVREVEDSRGALSRLILFGRTRISMPSGMEELFVAFSAFEAVARIEANYAVTGLEREQLAQELGLWKIHAQFEGVTFMFETDREAEQAQTNGLADECRSRYAELLKPHDAFGYFARKPIWSKCDSRETFERDYKGNWFFYTR
ncbi:hypothetical protein LY632_06400 [Erythrobacter sp. SDW2]|uniref:hypothetical protein n=1 Tax=Erythrobacter sp. SDW2 TaxID=2907154 RepID=UPI001F1E749A|nr:hypothetical protein [Erythrobacter sp. SDW2]UIP08018.1 hypothetical protein LY632_06400 [Erythrobacter sp. SDW2]